MCSTPPNSIPYFGSKSWTFWNLPLPLECEAAPLNPKIYCHPTILPKFYKSSFPHHPLRAWIKNTWTPYQASPEIVRTLLLSKRCWLLVFGLSPLLLDFKSQLHSAFGSCIMRRANLASRALLISLACFWPRPPFSFFFHKVIHSSKWIQRLSSFPHHINHWMHHSISLVTPIGNIPVYI